MNEGEDWMEDKNEWTTIHHPGGRERHYKGLTARRYSNFRELVDAVASGRPGLH